MVNKNNLGIGIIFLIFLVGLILFGIFSTRGNFHDAPQYITSAKALEGINNAKIHNSHSFVYPVFLALFLKLWKSLTILKLVNVFWLFLNAIILFWYSRSKKALLLLILSPLVWVHSIWISPVLPVSFFFLLSYVWLKKYQELKRKYYLILAGLSLGISPSLWAGSIPFIFFLILAFFYDKKLIDLGLFVISMLPGLAISFIVDYILFSFPLYSYFRIFGGTYIVFSGQNPDVAPYSITKELLLLLVIVSPLLFYLIKLRWLENKREIILFIGSWIFVFLFGVISYLIPFFGIMIIELSKILKKREFIINIFISVILIIILTYNYFGANSDYLTQRDFKEMEKQYNFEKIISGDISKGSKASAALIDALYFDSNKPWIIWGDDYSLCQTKSSVYRETNFDIKSKKFDVVRDLSIDVKLEVDCNQNFAKLPMILGRGEDVPKGYRPEKCYNLLCLYVPVN